MKTIEGIIPVMLTPFTADNKIDYLGLKRLIDWYIENGADALFAVCQSSEMQYLTLEERVELASFVLNIANNEYRLLRPGIFLMIWNSKFRSSMLWRQRALMRWC